MVFPVPSNLSFALLFYFPCLPSPFYLFPISHFVSDFYLNSEQEPIFTRKNIT